MQDDKAEEKEISRLRSALQFALHAFRGALSTHPGQMGLARGELTCLIALGQEHEMVPIGRLSWPEEREHRARLAKVGVT